MKFEIRPTLIAFEDDKPGEHATLLCNGNRLNFRGDISFFSDEQQKYIWVFEGWIREGDKLVFVTNDREVTGVVCGQYVIVDGANTAILPPVQPLRPIAELPAVAEILSSPNPRSPTRPVPLPKSQKPIQEPAFDSESKW